MTEKDFKVQKGIIVSDGNIQVNKSSNPTVFSKIFDTDVAAAASTLSGTTWAADGSNGAIGMTIAPKGAASFLNVTEGGMEGKIGQLTQYDAKVDTFLATGAVTLGTDSFASTVTQVGRSTANVTGRSVTITAGSAKTGGTADTGAGGNLILQGGAGKGEAAGGSIVFNVATAGSTANTLNTIDDMALTLASTKDATFGGDVYVTGRDLFLQSSATDTGKFTSTDSTLTLTHTATNGDIAITTSGDLDLFTDTIDVGKATPTNTTMTLRASANTAAGSTLKFIAGSTATGGSNNLAGGDLLLYGGAGKGSGVGGDIELWTSPAGTADVDSLNAAALALKVDTAKNSTFYGPIFIDDTAKIYEQDSGNNKHLHIRNINASDSNASHIYIEPNNGTGSTSNVGKVYIAGNLMMSDAAASAEFSINDVNQLQVSNIVGNTSIASPFNKIMGLSGSVGLVIGGGTSPTIANDEVAVHIKGGANQYAGGNNNNYTELRVSTNVADGSSTTNNEDLVVAVLENSDGTALTGSRGMVLSNGITGTNSGTWGVGTSRDSFDRFIIGRSTWLKSWDAVKGTDDSPFEHGRANQTQPYLTLDRLGNWEFQIGASTNANGGGGADGSATLNYHGGSMKFLGGASHSLNPYYRFEFLETGNTNATTAATGAEFRMHASTSGSVAEYYTGFKAPTTMQATVVTSAVVTKTYVITTLGDTTNSTASEGWNLFFGSGTNTTYSVGDTGTCAAITGTGINSSTGTVTEAMVYTMPTKTTDDNGYVLSSTKTGVLSWIAQSGGLGISGTASDGEVAIWDGSGSDTLVGDSNFTFNGKTLTVDTNTSGDAAEDLAGLHVDFDRTVAGSGTNAHNDIGINVDVNSASLGTSSLIGIDVDAVGAASGTSTSTGIDVSASGADKNYAAIFRTGLVGIGDTTPTNTLSVKDDVPSVAFTSTNAPGSGSNVTGPNLLFRAIRDGSEAGKAADDLGVIQFKGNDSAGNETLYGQFKTRANAVTNTSESGLMSFAVATTGSGSLGEIMTITGGAAVASSTVTILGNLDVQGDMTVLNNTQTAVEDKTLVLGVAGGMEEASYARSGTTVTVTSTAHGFNNAEIVYFSGASDYADGVYAVANKTTNTFEITSAGSGTVAAGAVVWHSSADVTETTATGSGFHVPGTTLHTMLYNSTNGWDSSEDLNLASGKHYSINGTTVLSASTLGSGVTSSSLTTVGTIGTGTWQGTAVADAYVANDLTISGGTINNTPIGGSTASTGKFTSVNVDAVAVIDTSSDTGQALTTTANLTLAEYPFATYRTVKYVGQIQEKVAGSTADKIDVFECLVSYKGTGAAVPSAGDLMITTYAYMSSEAAALGTLEVATSLPGGGGGDDTHIALIWNPATDSMTYSYAVTATQLVKHADMS